MPLAETPHILIVDDEPFNLEILTEYLEDANYKVLSAEDGEEAFSMLEQNKSIIDAVLLDRMMPKMNGMEVLKRIKMDPDLSKIPVIMQTAVGSAESVREGLQAGAYYYLTKPFDQSMLLAVVSAAVADRSNNRKLQEAIAKQQSTFKLLKQCVFAVQTLEEGYEVTSLLSSVCPDPQKIAIGLSELIINGIEHGNLGITYREKSQLLQQNRWHEEVESRLKNPQYQDKFVEVRYQKNPSEIIITITDQGAGFDWEPFLDFSPERAFDPHGRGISMARMISFDRVEYCGKGNQVIARISLIPKY